MFKKLFIFLLPLLIANVSYAKPLTGEEISKKYPRIQKMYVEYQFEQIENDDGGGPVVDTLAEVYKTSQKGCTAIFTLENDSGVGVHETIISFQGKQFKSGYFKAYYYQYNSEGKLISRKRTYTHDFEAQIAERGEKINNYELKREFKLIQNKMTKKTLKQCS